MSLVDRIDAALPQTQCTRCGYPDCRAYAQAVASGKAPINQCPPGGDEGIRRLAQLTGQAMLPLNPEHGIDGPLTVAIIDEHWCIGCTLCLDACPTDAIVGTNKRMHTVIEPWCTGCELCIPACPVDCIGLEPVSGTRTGWDAWTAEQAQTAKTRYHSRQQRLLREADEHHERLQAKALAKLQDLEAHTKSDSATETDRKRGIIEAALAKARSRQTATKPQTP
jgi:Na+-translocating ferredoxin:NAD+ oxidoreductase subunit B